eukprot:scaffold587759_cov17-Prasinocladus_malaysianus.AAC.1
MAAFYEGGAMSVPDRIPYESEDEYEYSYPVVLAVWRLSCPRPLFVRERQGALALLRHTESKKFESNPQQNNLRRRPHVEYRAQLLS